MRILVQRVLEASVSVEGDVVGQIGRGLLVFLGIRSEDRPHNAEQLVKKLSNLRIFPDSAGKMNRSLLDISGQLLVVSQFTLYGDTRKGNRPSYDAAAPVALAKPLYEYFVQHCRTVGLSVQTGVFQAQMQVNLVNDGPVTLLCSSEN
jgi:D-aminoacyl-tRNA deacylase